MSVPLEVERLGFISERCPATISQEIRIWFDPEDNTYGEIPSIELTMDDADRCGGLSFIINTVKRGFEGAVTKTETSMSWEMPERLPDTARWRLVDLVTDPLPA